ncbi:MAG: 30S ribosomal protein S5 [Candidatus Omnitrophota bacterium]|jgi:small subunit ribosomal protein S5
MDNENKNPQEQQAGQTGSPRSETQRDSDGKTPGRRRDRSSSRQGGGERPSQKKFVAEPSDYMEKVLSIKRVTKVTKGGKKLSFSALVVVGDMKGNVGYHLAKAGEVAIAIRKALMRAKKNMVKIPLKGTTIPHEIIGVCGGAEVLLKPASDGTGVIAAGAVRAVCEGAGIHNILTKCHRSNNPINVVKATMDGLTRMKFKQYKELEQVQTNATS